MKAENPYFPAFLFEVARLMLSGHQEVPGDAKGIESITGLLDSFRYWEKNYTIQKDIEPLFRAVYKHLERRLDVLVRPATPPYRLVFPNVRTGPMEQGEVRPHAVQSPGMGEEVQPAGVRMGNGD